MISVQRYYSEFICVHFIYIYNNEDLIRLIVDDKEMFDSYENAKLCCFIPDLKQLGLLDKCITCNSKYFCVFVPQ